MNQDTHEVGRYHIRAYDLHSITVNDQQYTHSFLIAPDQLIPNWPPQSVDQLISDHFASVLTLRAEILILGTGRQFQAPSPAQLQLLRDNHIAVEFMDTHAACRTYIALVSEGRAIAAALIIESTPSKI
jgi:uncharacterized protein